VRLPVLLVLLVRSAERVIGGNLHQDDPDAIGVLDPHLHKAPGLRCGFPDDKDCGCGQPGALGVNIPDLDLDHHRAPGRAGRVPGDFEQSPAEEDTTPGSSGGPNSR
jgi:hypothetical protein